MGSVSTPEVLPIGVQSLHLPSRMQEEMILSTAADPLHRSYIETYHFHTRQPVDAIRLSDAIHRIAGQHAILRSIFASRGANGSTEVQVAVLKPEHVRQKARLLAILPSTQPKHLSMIAFEIIDLDALDGGDWKGSMPWALSLTELPDCSEWRITLSYHHALMDGWSARHVLAGIRQEMLFPGSVTETSDFFEMDGEREPLRSKSIQGRLEESLRNANPPPPLGHESQSVSVQTHEIARPVSTRFAARPDQAAIPAWITRLALSITLCTFQNTNEAVFLEMTSGRKFLSQRNRRTVGLALTPQIRSVSLREDDSLAPSAQCFRSSHDIAHALSVSELKSFVPTWSQRIKFCLVCQTNDSYPSSGIEDWEWKGVDTESELPFLVEIMPRQAASFLVKIRFHQTTFEPSFVQDFLQYFCRAIEWLEEVHLEIGNWSLVAAITRLTTRSDYAQFYTEMAKKPSPEDDVCAHDLIDQTAIKWPNKIALQFENNNFMTYAELARRSTQLAGILKTQFTASRSQPLVPICFDKSLEMVVTILAVLKAGGAYVPLDPTHPAERLEAILRACKASLVLHGSSMEFPALAAACSSLSVQLESIDQLLSLDAGDLEVDRSTQHSASSLAYVLFTSGSTGAPKGVMVEHRNLVAFMVAGEGNADGSWTSTRLQLAAYSFDASIGDIFANLWQGGRLALVPRDTMLSSLHYWLDETCASHISLTPTVGDLILPNMPARLQTFMFGGEAFHSSFLAQAPTEAKIWNTCGPTETVVDIACCVLDPKKPSATPIGRPFGSSRLYIVRPGTNAVLPPQSIGELCIVGSQVSRGYLGRGDLTARGFMPDPFTESSKARMYRTGDLARLDVDGMVRHLGRIDGQVKLRGLRIETGEVETVIKQSSRTLTQVCVDVHQSVTGQDALVAWLVATGEEGIKDIRQAWDQTMLTACRRRLAGYMVPTVWILVSQLPLTTSAKLDRRALHGWFQKTEEGVSLDGIALLSTPRHRKDIPTKFGATERERTLAIRCAAILSIDAASISLDSTFISLGGTSLHAMRLLPSLRRERIKCSLAQLLGPTTLGELAAESPIQKSKSQLMEDVCNPLTDLQGWQRAVRDLGICPDAVEALYPCTPLQEGLISTSLQTDSSAYMAKMTIGIGGVVDQRRFQKAWRSVVSRHAILRTAFLASSDVDDRRASQHNFFQAVLRVSSDQVNCLFGLETRALRFQLGTIPLSGRVARAGRDWVLQLTMHHVLYDEAYLSRLVTELSIEYEDQSTGMTLEQLSPSSSFANFACALHARDLHSTRQFWKSYLDGAVPATWPIAGGLHTADAGKGAVEQLSHEWRGDVRSLAQSLKVTPAAVIRAALAITIAEHSDTNDIVIGEVSSGRVDHESFALGPCAATHPVRIQVDRTSGSWLQNVASSALESYLKVMPYQHHGVASIRKETTNSDLMPFQILFVHQEAYDKTFENLNKFHLKSIDLGSLGFPLVVQSRSSQENGCITIECSYDPTKISSTNMEWVLRHLSSALDLLSTSAEKKNWNDPSVALLDHKEQNTLIEWSSKPDDPLIVSPEVAESLCIHELADIQARQTPEKIAIQIDQKEFMTFRQLKERSDQVAHALSGKLGVMYSSLPEDRQPVVPICFDKGAGMIIAMMAVLKAGGVWVPIDPKHPRERIESILHQADARLIICGPNPVCENLQEAAGSTAAVMVDLDDLIQAQGSTRAPFRRSTPSSLAYILFTSGSTGTPKGVMLEHRNLITFLLAQEQSLMGTWISVRFQLAAYTFDAAVWEIFLPLSIGGRVVLTTASDVWSTLSDWLARTNTTHLFITPRAASLLTDRFPSYLRSLAIGGEAFDVSILPQVPEECRVFNGFGPTETTVFATRHLVLREDMYLQNVPIGRPFGASRIYILRPGSSNPVAIGAMGEICIGGPQVARGYLGRPEATEKVFVRNPYRANERLYRTGDLGRFSDRGVVEYLGRMDGQVKLRGLRIETAEIELVCLRHPKVISCVVIVFKRAEGDVLIGFVQVRGSRDTVNFSSWPTIENDLITLLGNNVPGYMIPSRLIERDQIPVTSHGKVDRRALQAQAQALDQQGQLLRAELGPNSMLVKGSLEDRVAEVWSQALGIDKEIIGPDVAFARLGGDSIRAIRLLSMLRTAGLNLTVVDLGNQSTVSTQAQRIVINQRKPISQPAIIPDDPADLGWVELSPIAHMYATLQQRTKHPDESAINHFNQSMLLDVTGIAPESLQFALQALQKHHDMLRIVVDWSFDSPASAWKMKVAPWSQTTPFILPPAQGATRDTLRSHIATKVRCLNIRQGRVMDAAIYQEHESGRTLLFWTIHHFVVDIVSWQLLLQDLNTILKTTETQVSLQPAMTSFPRWTLTGKEDSLETTSATPADHKSASGPRSQVMTECLPLWLREPSCAKTDSYLTHKSSAKIERTVTEFLLGPANEIHGTEPLDLLLTALGLTVGKFFRNEVQQLKIGLETHGRHVLDGAVDVSRTVGWFTTIIPLLLDCTSNLSSVERLVRHTRDRRSLIMQDNIGFRNFVGGRWRGQSSTEDPFSLVMNYQGVREDSEPTNDQAVWPATIPGIEWQDTSDKAISLSFAWMEVYIQNKEAHIECKWPNEPDTVVENVAAVFAEKVKNVCQALKSFPPGPSPIIISSSTSAFGLISEGCFDRIYDLLEEDGITTHTELEDIQPCTPMQRSLVFEGIANPAACFYITSRVWKLPDGKITISRARKAVTSLVRRHEVLRTRFLVDPEEGPISLVFKPSERTMAQCIESFKVRDSAQVAMEVDRIMNDTGAGHPLIQPFCARIVCSADYKNLRLVWRFHHSLVDAWSQDIIFHELAQLLVDDESERNMAVFGPSFGSFARFISEKDTSEDSNFWAKSLNGYESVLIPASLLARSPEEADAIVVEQACDLQTLANWDISPGALLSLAWSAVLSEVLDTEDVAHGMLFSGRNVPFEGVENVVGPCITTVPIRTRIEKHHSVVTALRQTERFLHSASKHSIIGAAGAAKASGIEASKLMTTLLNFFGTRTDALEDSRLRSVLDAYLIDDGLPPSLTLSCWRRETEENVLVMRLEQRHVLEPSMARVLMSRFAAYCHHLSNLPEVPLQQAIASATHEQSCLRKWSFSPFPAPGKETYACLHDLIAEKARAFPRKVALQFEESEFVTYGDLEQQTTKLARSIRKTVGFPWPSEQPVIPICFDRTVDMVITILSVLKAGAAFVPLSTSDPAGRLESIIRTTNSPFIIAGHAQSEDTLQEVLHSLAIDIYTLEHFSTVDSTVELPVQDSSSLAYVLFTSGSTGEPKGVMIEHRNVTSFISSEHGDIIGRWSSCRMPVAAYTFDVSMGDLLTGLAVGARIALVQGRKLLASMVEWSKRALVTTLSMTPSLASLFKMTVPVYLQTLLLAGEAFDSTIMQVMKDECRVWNGYGPTETFYATFHCVERTEDRGFIPIGRPYHGNRIYLLCPESLERVPIGAVGEICVCGTQVARGYLARPELTAGRFITDPSGGNGQMYRTGDLGRFHSDGKIEFLGRLDGQVKIRGQRAETAEIESIISSASDKIARAAVHVTSKQGSSGVTLTACIVASPKLAKLEVVELVESIIKPVCQHRLQPYMTPSTWICMDELPLTASGKTDKRKLAMWIQRIQNEEEVQAGWIVSSRSLESVEDEGGDIQPPVNVLEMMVRETCASLLNQDGAKISMRSSFIALGGDSLLALQLNARLRAEGLSSTPRAILQARSLASLANMSRSFNDARSQRLTESMNLDSVGTWADWEMTEWQTAAQHAGFGMESIQHCMPCTPLQEGVLSSGLSGGNINAYLAVVKVRLGKKINTDGIRNAWCSLVYQEEMLRTAYILNVESGSNEASKLSPFLQVVLHPECAEVKRKMTLNTACTSKDQLETSEPHPLLDVDFHLGDIPLSALLTKTDDESEEELTLEVSVHHASYDEAYLSGLLSRLSMLYRDATKSPADAPTDTTLTGDNRIPFSAFVKYIYSKDSEMTARFWKRHLNGAEPASWPLKNGLQRSMGAMGEPMMKSLQWKGRLALIAKQLHVTPAAIVRAAIALVVAEHANNPDVVLGEVSNGQPEILSQGQTIQGFISGPCASTHPVRLRLTDETGKKRCSLRELVQRSFNTYLECLPHQYCGLTRIREQCDRTDLIPFQVLFVYQDAFLKSDPVAEGTHFEIRNGKLGNMGFPLVIGCARSADDSVVSFNCSYAPEILDSVAIDWFLHHITDALNVISQVAHTESPSTEAFRAIPAELAPSFQEKKQLESWSREIPIHEDRRVIPDWTIDQVFQQTARAMPNKIALQFEQSGWITYGDLDRRSSQVSAALRSRLAVTDSDYGSAVVPICYERGVDMVVAILAVMKAGAAYTPLNPSQPRDRLATLVRKAEPTVILCGTSQRDAKLLEASGAVGADLTTLEDLYDEPLMSRAPDPQHDSSSTAIVLFTSGSTGQPKGVMIGHRNLMSFFKHNQIDATGTWHSCRVPIASYTWDASILDIIVTLCNGGRLVLVPEQTLLPSLTHWIEISKATHLLMSVTIGRLLCDGFRDRTALSHLRVLLLGGEAFDTAVLRHVPDECRIYNAYGPTETVVYVTLHRVHKSLSVGDSGVPIGGPFGKNAVYLLRLDSDGCVPLGAVGEICVAGDQVSQGYLGQPDVTKRHFCPNLVNPSQGRVLYRTGDLGRYNSNGHIEYFGRKDAQVKVRGQRVELSEIEAVVLKHELVTGSAVVAVDTPPGAVLICFYLVGSCDLSDDKWKATASDIKLHTEFRLPSHMVPSHFIKLAGEFPRSSTGKTDRKALTEMARAMMAETGFEQEREYAPPTTKTEAILCEVFGDILSRRVGITDNFVDLGGHSVLAIRAVSKINHRLNSQISLRHVFDFPTPRALANQVEDNTTHEEYVTIPRCLRDQNAEQSFAQSRLWFLEQLHPGSVSYLMPMGLRIHGRLDLEALEQALQAIECRHETLRTTFECRDGCNVQVVHPFRPGKLMVIDTSSECDQGPLGVLREEQTKPFNLQVHPGWRVTLLRSSPTEHVLSIVMHHIISDGWSVGIVLRELSMLYTTAVTGGQLDNCLEPLAIQYRDFAVWQKDEKQAAEHQRQLDYWAEKLTGSQPAQLLLDKPRPETMSGDALFEEVRLEGDMYQALSKFSKKSQVTPFIVLLAAFRAAHYRLTGATDATIGTPIANRGRAELESLIGLFVNLQCIRIQLDDTDSFKALVNRVQSTVHEAFAHQDVPFERIVSVLHPTRDVSRNPLVQTIFAVHPQISGELRLKDLQTEEILLSQTSRMDLEVHLFQGNNGLQGQVIFARDLFAPETIRALISTFYAILDCGLQDSNALLGSMPLMKSTAPLRERGLLDIKRTSYPRDNSLVDVFRQQVAKHPVRLAVCDNKRSVTYRELDSESDRITGWLLDQSLAPETLVAVLAPRSVETIAAILGILKANLAYLPLDSNTSVGRLKGVFSCVQHRLVVLVGSDVQIPILPELEQVQFTRINEVLTTQTSEHQGTLRAGPHASSLAYIMFTSGSTGKPKGVMIEHRGVIRLVKNCNFVSEEHHGKPVAHMANISFDVSTWEIYFALLNGGTLVCVDAMTSLDSAALDRRFRHEQVRVAMFTPALFKSHLQQSPATIKRLEALVLGGDRLNVQDVASAQDLVQGEIVNGYGPTENTGASAIYRVPRQEHCLNGVPIGEAITNSGIYVMDQHLRLVPPGIIGELVVTGDGLARGYTDKRRDEGCFVMIDLDGERTRAYRTGDYGRWRPADGQLEYFSRRDNQVKIRGHRVELGEIEQTTLAHSSVKNAVAVVQEVEGEQSQLAVFVTPSGETDDAVENEQVEAWKDIFDAETYHKIADMTLDKLGRDFTGWLSMYDGSIIGTLEMEEWLDDTVQTLLNGNHPRRILEIGTGSGMILFNIASGLEQYVGVEPVEKLAAAVQQRADRHEELGGKVQLHAGTADQILTLCADFSPRLVVVNSVAQYFPSAEYLFQLVQDLLQLRSVETLFFGDMRSYPLYDQFLVSKALHVAGARANMTQIRQIMVDTMEVETELLVDPAFFTSLVSRLPGQVDHVEILPKRMTATNELSCYRYAAVIHVNNDRVGCRRVHHIKGEHWLDFIKEDLSPMAIKRRLEADPISPVAVANIPHRKTVLEKHIANAVAGDLYNGEIQDSWQLQYRNQAATNPGLAAIDLEKLGQQTGFQVEISWARQHSQSGGLDAIFHRLNPNHAEERVLFGFPTDHQDRPFASFSNHPVRTQLHRKIQSQLRHSLEASLPSYMVPSTITILDQMPLTDRGKVNRRLLARKVQRPQKTVVRTIPSESSGPSTVNSTIERLMCEVFGDILGAKVTPADSFFALGGHSLLVPRAASLLSKRLYRSVTVRDIFDFPTPASLAGRFGSAHVDESSDTAGITSQAESVHSRIAESIDWVQSVEVWGLRADEVVEAHPCTPFQAGVLSNGKAAAHSTNSSYLNIVRLGLAGEQIDPAALRIAWHAIVRQEGMLRTAFVPYAANPGTSVGIASDTFLQAVLKLESREVRRVLEVSLPTGQSSSPVYIDFGQIPVSLGLVWAGNGSDMQAEFAIHHALYDETYISWVLAGLSRNYHCARTTGRCDAGPPNAPLGPVLVPFSTFVSQLQSQDYADTTLFWENYLSGAPVASWPIAGGLDMTRSSSRGVRDSLSVEWDGDLRALAGRQGVTPATIARAAVALVVADHSGEDEVILGEVSSGRSFTEASGFVAGPCIATHPVRIQLQSRGLSSTEQRASLEEITKHALESYLETLPNQHLGLSSIRQQTHTPDLLPFQVLFVYQQPLGHAATQEQVGNCLTVQDGKPGQTEFPVVFEAACNPTDGHLRLRCTFDPVALPTEDAVQLLDHITQVLHTMNRQATSPARLTVSPEETDLLKHLATCPEPQYFSRPQSKDDMCAHDLIHRQALRTPNKIAVQFELTHFITYGELDQRSTALANSIRSFCGLQGGTRSLLIPISFDKGVDMVVAILGILKAGAAYVPLDASHPETRLRSICQSVNAELILWDGRPRADTLRIVAQAAEASLLTIGELSLVQSEASLSPAKQSPSSLAYVIYTSGSTGTPKGVMVTHRNLVFLMTSTRGASFVGWTDNRLQLSAYTFDVSVCDLFCPLAIGGRVSMVRKERIWTELLEWTETLVINTLSTTASVADVLAPGLERGHLASLRTLMLGGEPIGRNILEKSPRELTVWNRYGPTETTVDVISCMLQGPRMSDDVAHRPFVPIGRPNRDNRIYLLRPQTEDLVPIGVPGEICIAGPQVSDGYRGHDELTVVRFQADPFADSAKMYRTGDWGRMHADGMIEFLGRIDHQVKFHGLRIELGEIESAAKTCSGVKASVVVKVECRGSEALVAIVEAAVMENKKVKCRDEEEHGGKLTHWEEEVVDEEIVRNHVAQRVPSYMVPAHIHVQTTPLPRTVNDKLDRRRIMEQATKIVEHPTLSVSSARRRPQPGSLEARIASCWSRNLALSEDKIDIGAPFARLGGDSIRAISLLALLRREGLPLNMADFRPSATIQMQAARLRQETLRGDVPGYIQVVARTGSQATMVWFHPMMGQCSVFEDIVPALDPRYNLVLISDPFFGTAEGPATLRDWAAYYLQDLEPQLTRGQPLVLGGYSFGGLLAIEMATLWHEKHGSPPSSLIIGDTRPYQTATSLFRNAQERQESEEAAANQFGSGEMRMIQEHFSKHERIWSQSRCPPVYHGRCLLLGTPQARAEGVASWWQSQCPRIEVRDLDCTHGELFDPKMTGRVSTLINEHCDLWRMSTSDGFSSDSDQRASRELHTPDDESDSA